MITSFSKTILKTLTAFLIFIIVITTIVQGQTPTPSPTCNPNVAPATNSAMAWRQNALVSVNIDSSKFTPEEFNCIKAIFTGYNLQNAAAQGNSSGVFFSLTYSSNPLVVVNGSGQVVRTTYGGNFSNVYEVTKANIDEFGRTGPVGNESNLTGAITQINDDINSNSCAALQETIGHEIAHTLGLDHCRQNASGQDICFLLKNLSTRQ